ncbi:MAG: hypothetical protein QOH88_2180 [Verrucomicrobiota bacterium]
MKPGRLFIVVLLVSAAGLAQLGAETLVYPKADPVFTIEVPAGWKSTYSSDGSLNLEKTGGDPVVMILVAPNVTDEASAKASGGTLGQFAKVVGLTEPKVDGEIRTLHLPSGKEAYGIDYKGKINGKDGVCKFMVFAPTKGKYFMMAVLGTMDGIKATAEEGGRMVNSITRK